jgi:hypothetical protein
MSRDWRTDVVWGLGHGAFAALLFGGLAILVYTFDPTASTDTEMTLEMALAIYSGSGLGGGIILGFFRPLYGSAVGGAFAGFVIAFLVYGVGILVTQPHMSLTATFWGAIACACLVGIPVGIYHVKASR